MENSRIYVETHASVYAYHNALR